MFKQHAGKIVGLLASHLVSFTGFFAVSETMDVTELRGIDLYVVIAFYVFQTVVGIYFGDRYDRKTYVKDFIFSLKSKDYAVNIFEKIVALVERDTDSRLTIYLLQVKKGISLEERQLFEQLLTSTTRKSDVVAKWSNDQYMIIAVEHIGKRSTVVERIKQQSSLSFLSGYATYPVEGENLQQLLQVAKERMYAERLQT